MALNIIDKVNSRLKFLHRQSRFLTPLLRRLFRNALIQPLSDYACTGWFSNLSKRLQLRFQVSENIWIGFCVQLDKTSKIRVQEFLQSNWLSIGDRYLQFIALRETCLYSEFFWSAFSRIKSECVKIQTGKTPNTDTSHAVLSPILSNFTMTNVLTILMKLVKLLV